VKLLAAVLGAVGAAGLAVVALLLVVPVVLTSAAHAEAEPSADALADIPAPVLALYQRAAGTCDLPWSVLAAVGKIETDHGRSSQPGVHAGTNAAGAARPMQFLASTWAAYGVDGDSDGTADIYSAADSIAGAANYLCANGAGDRAHLRDALWHYNHDDSYVDAVLAQAGLYGSIVTGPGRYVLPLTGIDPRALVAPHHDYPAIDLPVAVATPTYAVVAGTVLEAELGIGDCGGTVVLLGEDGNRYTYCHLSRVLVAAGQPLVAGAIVGLTGGAPGTTGAGHSTGPHLHFAIEVAGHAVCPQDVLVAWASGHAVDPASAPRSGCTT
jgi:murein DD-endopeptidase MepM/ murein hydrolase activator NlpD